MNDAYAGGCHCGAVRFQIRGKLLAMVDCQCRDCQRRSGTGHSSYLTFAARAAEVQTGEVKHWQVIGDAGTVKHHAFCPVCGAPVSLTFPGMPEVFGVHAAALDDTSRYAPQFVTYAASAPAWDAVAPTLQRFDGMPPQA